MRAIPTTYLGTTFRSRLEADWAATLTSLGIAWHYEPEGYTLSDGTLYLPDFYLPDLRAWFEVKGPHDQRLRKVEQFVTDLMAEAGVDTLDDPAAPLVLLGRIPTTPEPLLPWEVLRWLAAPGASVLLAHCPGCGRNVVAVIGAHTCRACGWTPADYTDWHQHARWLTPFVRTRRPHAPTVRT